MSLIHFTTRQLRVNRVTSALLRVTFSPQLPMLRRKHGLESIKLLSLIHV